MTTSEHEMLAVNQQLGQSLEALRVHAARANRELYGLVATDLDTARADAREANARADLKQREVDALKERLRRAAVRADATQVKLGAARQRLRTAQERARVAQERERAARARVAKLEHKIVTMKASRRWRAGAAVEHAVVVVRRTAVSRLGRLRRIEAK